MPSPGIRKRHRRQVDTETAFAPRVEVSPTVHEAEEGEGEDGAQQNSIEACEKSKDLLASGQTSPAKAQDADQVQPTTTNPINTAATAPEGAADPLERISPIEPESGTTSVSGGDDDGKNRPVQSNQQQPNRAATTTPATATTRPTPIARAETPSVASTTSSTDLPRWVTLRLEQEDDMKAQTLKELFSRIGAGVVYAAGFLVIVTLIRGSCSFFRTLCLVPVKLLSMLHRRFASYVMKERVLRAAGADDEGGNASLRQHRTDGVVNTFRRVRTADAPPIHPREIQLIYNAREAKCLPPFEVGEKYLDPLYQRHVATAVGSARPYTPNSYYREVLHSDYDGCTLCVDWMFSRIDPSTNYDAVDGKKQSAEEGKPLSQKVLHSLDALLDQIRSGRTTPPQHQSASSKNEKNRRNGVPGFKGVVGVIPGLASSSHSPYIETVCRYLTENGYHAAVMNARGMGSTPLDQPSIMTGAFTDDIRSIVRKCFNEERLKTQLGIEGPLYLVGFSLGGSMLCKYLGEEGRNPKSRVNTRVKAAVSACSPWDFHESSANMETWEAHVIYQPHLAKGIREYMERHREVCRGIREVDVDHLLSSPKLTSTVQSIDEAIVAPVAGFGSRQEYYTAATPMPYLNDIKMPLLCLTAADDPITGPPPRDARWEAIIAKNSNISYAKTPCGGHLGFLQGFWDETFRKGNFMERAVVAHFENCRARDGLIDPRAE